jgi:hypothetical protein
MILLVLTIFYFVVGMYCAVLHQQYTLDQTWKDYVVLTLLWPIVLYHGLRAVYRQYKERPFR